jgi:hypothetical protein
MQAGMRHGYAVALNPVQLFCCMTVNLLQRRQRQQQQQLCTWSGEPQPVELTVGFEPQQPGLSA